MSKSIAGTSRQPRVVRAQTPEPVAPVARSEAEIQNEIQQRNADFPEYTVAQLKKLWAAQKKGLTKEQLAAIAFYQGAGYRALNKALRSGEIVNDAKLTNIDNELDSVSTLLPANTTLTRGIRASGRIDGSDAATNRSYRFVQSFFQAFQNNTLEGTRFNDKGYTSTSVGLTSFGGSGSQGPSYEALSIRFRIRAQSGKRVIIPNPAKYGGGEKEILLPKNAAFTIRNAEYGKNKQELIIDVDLD